VVDLLIKLLAKDPTKRIKSCEDIKRHPWLIDVNWKKYMDKEVQPPFVPSLRESNFDPEFNDLSVDFDELQMKLRMSTERRLSYYYESTV
jgi:serine/threonine protein kinase